ncbi:MAG: DnaJ C-terminal domain-containing protein, partial [Verrucomicrobiota bacterium]
MEEAMHGAPRSISMQAVNCLTGQTDTQEFQVRIPPGITDGRRIRVPDHGEAGHGNAPAG